MTAPSTKPRLLIVELWGLGDLAIATPFLRAAVEKYDVTIVAKPYAKGLQSRLWPDAKVLPFVAPWTAFRKKYRLHKWPWPEMLRIAQTIRGMQFDVALSARWDPRDHFLLGFSGAKRRLGFPRIGSRIFLTEPIHRPEPAAHRYESWRALGRAINLELPPRGEIVASGPARGSRRAILVHTGAGQAIRVWPLPSYRKLVDHLRENQFLVRVVCDLDQRDWWLRNGEPEVATPRTVAELQVLLDNTSALIGNDSGPGHLAAFAGVPTFTIFGPQLPEWFAPLHPASQWVEGKACPYKPCSDYCQFAEPICLTGLTETEVWARVEPFVRAITADRRPAT
jgi:heptosyltransferase-2